MFSCIGFLNTRILFYGDPSTVLRGKDLKFKVPIPQFGWRDSLYGRLPCRNLIKGNALQDKICFEIHEKIAR